MPLRPQIFAAIASRQPCFFAAAASADDAIRDTRHLLLFTFCFLRRADAMLIRQPLLLRRHMRACLLPMLPLDIFAGARCCARYAALRLLRALR